MSADLAALISRGVSAEGLVRGLVAYLDKEWQTQLDVYGDPGTSEVDKQEAYGKLLAIHAPRAVCAAAVEIWDTEATPPATVVPITSTP